jgi:hypothetical protein
MKATLVLTIGLALIGCDTAHAASLSYTQNVTAFAIFVDGEEHNDNFDTIYFRVTPNSPAVFTRIAMLFGVPRLPGDPLTYPNQMLNADPGDIPGGLALSQFGLIRTPEEMSFTVAKLGGIISTASEPNGDLFLGNINMPGAGATANVTVQLLRAGSLVEQLTAVVPIPEPAALAMAGMGMVVLVVSFRFRGNA